MSRGAFNRNMMAYYASVFPNSAFDPFGSKSAVPTSPSLNLSQFSNKPVAPMAPRQFDPPTPSYSKPPQSNSNLPVYTSHLTTTTGTATTTTTTKVDNFRHPPLSTTAVSAAKSASDYRIPPIGNHASNSLTTSQPTQVPKAMKPQPNVTSTLKIDLKSFESQGGSSFGSLNSVKVPPHVVIGAAEGAAMGALRGGSATSAIAGAAEGAIISAITGDNGPLSFASSFHK